MGDEKKDSAKAKMTHLLSYAGSRGQEMRLHDAEFKGEHYFDFRFYEKQNRGMVPTKKGVRLGIRSVGFLEDAISRWKSFVKTADSQVPEKAEETARKKKVAPAGKPEAECVAAG